MMGEPVTTRETLDFLLHDWLRVDALCARPRFAEHSRATFDAALDLTPFDAWIDELDSELDVAG